MDLISIVIPVYKVEPYIEACIQSIVNQTYNNIEIILVDDGSPDNCGHICDQWALKDDRIKVIHKANGGLSEARNYGIERANGKYIAFVDSDDYVENTYISYLYSLITKYDSEIACCDGFVEDIEGNVLNSRHRKKKEDCFDKEKALKEMLYEKLFSNSAWAKMYKLELFSDIRYPVGKIYEDIYTTYKLIDKCKKVSFGPEKHYHYIVRGNSILGKVSLKKYNDLLGGTKEVLDFAKAKHTNLYNAAIYRYAISLLITCIEIPSDSNNKEEQKLTENSWKKYVRLRHMILFNIKAPMKYKVLTIMSFLGRKTTQKIFQKYLKRR